MEKSTALLVMDMQMGIINTYPDGEMIIGTIAKAIQAARRKGIPIMYVRLNFRPGAPDISMNNKSFSTGIKELWAKTNPAEFEKIHPDLAPAEGDIIVTKKRISAFTGSDLELVVRSMGIQHLVLSGFATSGVVLSTLREAADKDYVLTVLEDGCADRDPEVHRVLTTKIFPRQANVVTVEEWSK